MCGLPHPHRPHPLGWVGAVTCSDCGTLLPTDQTIRGEGVDMRLHTCPCGSRFMSEQRIKMRLAPAAPHKAPPNRVPATAGPPQAPPREPECTPAEGRGVGGVLPLSGSSPSNPAPSEPPDQTPARVERRKTPRAKVVYSAGFEVLWEQTGRGHKEPAQRAWESQGRPLVGDVVAAWKAYIASLDDWRNPKDLSSWLNISGHLQQWKPAAPKPAAVTPIKTFAQQAADRQADAALDARLESAFERARR